MSTKEDPKKLIEKRFDKYILSNSHYTSPQIEFLNFLKKIFAERKHIELEDLGESQLGEEDPISLFTKGELQNIVKLCNDIKMC